MVWLCIAKFNSHGLTLDKYSHRLLPPLCHGKYTCLMHVRKAHQTLLLLCSLKGAYTHVHIIAALF